MKLKNNTILITGGTSGIGYALAKEFKALGNKVIVLGRNKDKLEKLQQEGFETMMCDLSKTMDIEKVVIEIEQKYPDLNVLFNNAGIQYNYEITNTVIPIDKIRDEIDTNVTGQIILTQLILPILANKEKSYVLNTTSALGAFPKPDGLVYSSSKAALRNFTVGLRYALKKNGIKVLEFIPPVTDTAMTSERDGNKMSVEKLLRKIIPQIENEKPTITTGSVRFFLLLSLLLPGLANKIVSK